MINYIYILIYSFILVSSMIYIWHKLLNRKIDFNNPKMYITLINLMLFSVLNYFMVNKFIKVALITVIFMFFFRYLFKSKIYKCIVTPIFYQLIIMISETIFALIITLFRINITLTITSPFINMLSNIAIAIISIGISKIYLVKQSYKSILKITDKINDLHLLLFCVLAMIGANILSMSIYYKIDFLYLLLFNIIMTFILFVMLFHFFRTQNNYNKVYDKYNVAINSLTDYEEMMSKYRISNHENKNLLLTVRAMVINKDKDIPEYIDSIIQSRYDDDEKLLFKMSVIPSGGLRATIYSEILKIKENKMSYSLDIDKNVKTLDLIELDTNTVIEICKIIGVFIDNAIEEVKNIKDKKDKNIYISLYVEDNSLNIKVTNNYRGDINVSRIYDEGYTTKGKGHGYGLPLVKKLIDNNELFENQTQISKEVISQILIIKYKKTS